MISGGSRGIGLATARAFARAGASVSLAGRHSETVERAVAELHALGGGHVARKVIGTVADLSQPDDVQRFVDQTLSVFDRVDILVNNVGAARSAAFLELTDEILLSAWSLKLLCAIRLTRALAPVMERHGGGHVVNVAGTSGREPPPDSIAVGTTNAALRAFTRGVAPVLARMGISINLVTPGKVRTDRLLEQAERSARVRGTTADQVIAQGLKDTPTGRITEPEEVAEVILFLASGNVPNLTGADIVLDGGASKSI
jgi:NAD(P)-dependent dehydrogenase (short-subunit alcohol dehydrogenase family)